MRHLRAVAFLALLLLALPGCGAKGDDSASRKIRVTTTVGMVADLVKNVGGDRVEVIALMGPGVDPHLYKASEGDIARLSEADIMFYNGLVLEGKMGEIMEKLRERGKKTVAVAERIDHALLRKPPEFKGHPDPHVWFDVSMWASTIDAAVDGLASLDAASRPMFEANAARYRETLARAARGMHRRRSRPSPGSSACWSPRTTPSATSAAPTTSRWSACRASARPRRTGLKDVERLVDLVVDRKVKAIFVESSVPTRSIEAVVEGCRARGHDVEIGGQLFSDAMGAAGTPEGTYVGMVRHNVNTIVGALR